jgi:hypothetical protein
MGGPDGGNPGPDANQVDIDADNSPSGRIAMARAATDGALDIALDGVLVTYVKPLIASEPAGFFIQADIDGPALFVEVDPATLSPSPAPGDEVSLTITEIGTIAGGVRKVSKIEDFSVDSSGNSLDDLVQVVTNDATIVSNVVSFEAELIELSGTVTAAFGYAGMGHTAALIATAGVSDSEDLKLRIPDAVQDVVGLSEGCTFTVRGVMWRFNDTAQPSAWAATDIDDISCGPPQVVKAVAGSETSVVVTFDRAIDEASVLTDGSQFSFSPALLSSAASVDGNKVTVTTSAQDTNTTYTVTVADTVEDNAGNGVDSGANTADFKGFTPPAVVVFNEINANVDEGTGVTCDLIELRVTSGGSMAGFRLLERTTVLMEEELNGGFGSLEVDTNDILVIHLDAASCNDNNAPNEFGSPNEQPTVAHPRNYDTAYDFWINDSGLTNTTNVLTLYDALDNIVDGVLLTNSNTANDPAGASETQAELLVAQDQWTETDGSVPAGGFKNMLFHDHAVPGLGATGGSRLGDSIQRTGNDDNNHKGDWTTAPAAQTWGAANVGQPSL